MFLYLSFLLIVFKWLPVQALFLIFVERVPGRGVVFGQTHYKKTPRNGFALPHNKLCGHIQRKDL